MTLDPGDFDLDTRVDPDGPGRWTTTVTDRWDGLAGQSNGGYLVSLVLRALASALDLPDPVSVSALFVRPGRHGPATIDTTVVKQGRRIGFATGVLRQGGDDVVRVQAAFGDLAAPALPPLAYERDKPPQLPPPDECFDPVSGNPHAERYAAHSVMGRLETRIPEPPGWSAGRPSGHPSTELWVRFRNGRRPDPSSMAQFADGLPPVIAELGAWSTTVELTVHVRARPVPGWLRARVDTRHVGSGFHDEQVELWDESDTLVAESRQLALVLPPPTGRRDA